MEIPSLIPAPFASLEPSALVLVVYGLLLLFFVIYTLILLYHWIRYAEKKSVSTLSFIVYGLVSFLLITSLTISAFAY